MPIRSNRLNTEQYKENFREVRPAFDNREATLVEANRCLFCYDAPCTKSCPTGIDVPKFIKQITTDNVKGSAHTIFEANIFGAGCSRVCPVEKLCEGACVFNLLHEPPIPIARLQRYSTEKAIHENWQLFRRKEATGKRVAVVGAGPAGLACAHRLAREGMEVDIFEKENKGGGLMTYGIAAYKVTPQFCEDEVNYITAVGGIRILYNQQLGVTLSLADLQSGYDAVFLGMGVGLARQLEIPGEEALGVVDAIEFIYHLRANAYNQIPVGDRVIVIGMGMTAIDAATQARRLGAQEVTIVYRRTEAEKPCTDYELNIARLDGCNLVWLAAPKEVIVENGQVKGLVCSNMKLGTADTTGRHSPVDTGETFFLKADMIIKAAGQMPFAELMQQEQLANAHGKLIIKENGQTNFPGVFAGGDCVNGGKEVVDAVQAGKVAAAGIIEYLGCK